MEEGRSVVMNQTQHVNFLVGYLPTSEDSALVSPTAARMLAFNRDLIPVTMTNFINNPSGQLYLGSVLIQNNIQVLVTL